MSMFLNRFEPLINKYPSDADALSRVAEFFSVRELKGLEFSSLRITPERLQVIANVNNHARLSRLIVVLLSEKILDRSVVINSPTGGGIAEFDSIADVPDVIHDTFRDMDMEVTAGDLKTLYRIHAA